MFSQDSTIRLQSLDCAASDVNLPTSARDSWHSILLERALEGEEFDLLHKDLRDTPVYFERAIRDEISSGQSSVSSLVPYSRRYFERLVGKF